MTMKTLLTIDFDFFVPERPEWDFGHREALIFLNMLWSTRFGYVDKMKTDGNEVGFWDTIDQKNIKKPVWVSDSHAYAYSLLYGVSRVVLFDAHHDCWKGDGREGVACDNWLRVWLKGSKKRQAVWVQPEWLEDGLYSVPDDLKGRLEVVRWKKGMDLGLEGAVTAHVCRSGCWVPPWLDKAFLGFVGALAGDLSPVPMQHGDWDPLNERWSAEDFEKVRAADKEFQRMRDTAFGTIGSDKFLNCMVEQKV
jgi:hypothetical protein